ncbi:LuxR C-terminal-related transcriptional regulator [Streptomyces sp. NPDC059708]|uniref:LuxR C-terminal-related transcriptional regulator n=1 Tax=Streptomyces sp. NPDC059708 TaxID=3346916 RepID=UPI003675A433
MPSITERTVKKHVTTVLDKLRVTSRLQAALIANHQHHELCRVPDAHAHPPADRTGRPPFRDGHTPRLP